METKTELVKASGAIHIVHNFSLLQSQLWDFILAQTPAEDILTKESHQLPFSAIMKFLESTRNRDHVKAALEEMSSIYTYTVIKKENLDWGCFKLFESAIITDGIFTYSYDKAIKNLIANPDVYSRINLSMLRKFNSKYSLALHSLCFDYKKVSQTPWLTLREFCNYMGIEEESYTEFSLLNYHVIKKAIKEVNDKSDLFVKVVNKIENRKTTAVKFVITDKNMVVKARFKRIDRMFDSL